MDPDTAAFLQQLLERVARLERALGIEPPAGEREGSSAAEPVAEEAPAPGASAAALDAPAEPVPAGQEPEAVLDHDASPESGDAPDAYAARAAAFRRLAGTREPDDEMIELELEAAAELRDSTAPEAAASAAGPTSPQPPQPPPARQRGGFEVWFAERWLAWVGSIVVVLAVGFFVRLAYEEGWIGRLPAPVKAGLAALFGLTLVAAGEWALRSVGRIASVGLYAAGVGVLYLTAYATFRYYHLVGEGGAFGLMLVVALAGFAISVRARMLTMAVLSVVAGHLTPILLSHASSFTAALPLYLSFLLAIALGLSAWDGGTFRRLRYVVMGGHGLLATAWLIGDGVTIPLTAMAFLTLWWAMLSAEGVLAACRSESPLGNVFASLLNTAWFAPVGAWTIARQGYAFDPSGAFALAVAGIAAALAWWLGGGIAVWRRPVETPRDKLAIGFWAQAGVLLAFAIALQFDGYGQTIGWLAVALAAIEIGRRLPSRGVDIFGLLVLAAALARLLLLDRFAPALRGTLVAWPQFTLTHWTVLALCAVGVLQAAGRRIRCPGAPAWPHAAWQLAALGVIGWLALCDHAADGVVASAGWLVGVALLLAFEPWGRTQRYLQLAAVGLILAAARWLILDTALERLRPGWDARGALPVVNMQFGLALAIAALGWWAARRHARQPASAGGGLDVRGALLVAAGAGLLLVGASFEIDRAVERVFLLGGAEWSRWHVKHLLWTMVWTAGGVALGVWAGWTRPDGNGGAWLLRRVAWSLLLGSAVKWLVFDTLAWRFLLDATQWAGARPVANLQMLSGVTLVVGAGVLIWRIGVPGWLRVPGNWRADAVLVIAGAGLVWWGLSFELERGLAIWEQTHAVAWSWLTLRLLWLLVLWALGGALLAAAGLWRDIRELTLTGLVVLLLCAAGWLTGGTLQPRMADGVTAVPPVANLQTLGGLAIFGLLAALIAWTRRSHRGPAAAADMAMGRRIAEGLLLAFGLWVGSLELDRWLAPGVGGGPSGGAARLTALSIYWGVYAIGLIALGLAGRVAWIRYAGLGLLSITALKVLVIDMSEARYVYRVASLLVTGLLLIATSVAYTRLARRFVEPEGEPGSGAQGPA